MRCIRTQHVGLYLVGVDDEYVTSGTTTLADGSFAESVDDSNNNNRERLSSYACISGFRPIFLLKSNIKIEKTGHQAYGPGGFKDYPPQIGI